jgi:glycerate dehydrogenase
MKIVVLDSQMLNKNDPSWDRIRTFGELIIHDTTPKEMVVERICDATAVYTNKTVLSRDIIEKCPKLKWVGVFGTGFNVVDAVACKDHGVLLANVPEYSTNAVAQHTFSLLLSITCRTQNLSDQVHNGNWMPATLAAFQKNELTELFGKTFGIIGFGNIGKAVSKIAVAFGMKVLVYSRTKRPEYENENLSFVDMKTLLNCSDIISLHCPLTDETAKLINKQAIDQMKDGVILINTARGGILDECDVAQALKSKKISALGADVVSFEPIREDNPLLKLENAIITPHVAWAPTETRERLMQVSADNLYNFLNGNPTNIVNL